MSGKLLDMNRYAPPATGSFSNLYDAGTGADPTLTLSTTRGTQLKFGAGSISNNTDYVKAATKSRAASASHDIIARVRYPLIFNFSLAGICVADGTKLVTFGFGPTSNGTHGVKVSRWTNDTTFSSDRLSNFPVSPQVEWLRIGVVSDDPKDFYVSHNGVDWFHILSESQTGHLTFTQCGFVHVVNAQAGSSWALNNTERMVSDIMYYKDPDINPGF